MNFRYTMVGLAVANFFLAFIAEVSVLDQYDELVKMYLIINVLIAILLLVVRG